MLAGESPPAAVTGFLATLNYHPRPGGRRPLRLKTAMDNRPALASIRRGPRNPGFAESNVVAKASLEKAQKVYDGTRPLVADDVAECVLFAANRPAHVNLDNILVMPTDQANPYFVHRES